MPAVRAVVVQDLIYTTSYVHDSVSVREIKAWFQAQPSAHALAVVGKDNDFGLITRMDFNTLLLEHSGDSIFFEQSISNIMNKKPMCAKSDTSLQDLLEILLVELENEKRFYEDIIVHDQDNVFLGLISMRDVLTDQMGSLMHRLTAMEAQHTALAKQNKELFENSFKQGQRETQFRSYFERSPLPMIIFDHEGRFLAASQRFYRLSHYPNKQIDSHWGFQRFFSDDWYGIKKQNQDSWSELGPSDEAFQTLTLLPNNKDPIKVSAVVEVSPDWGHLLVSILGTDDSDPSSGSIVQATSQKTVGKITSAIKARLKEGNKQGLARTVATNLIDRENEVDRLMKKLEKIFTFADQVENTKSETPDSTSTETKDEREHLKGKLDEFSVIDLCQILIQGTKTGQLLLYKPNEEELTAYIYFYCGAITHAKHRDGFEGIDSLPQIMKIKKGRFDFIFNKSTPKTTIQGDPMGLLMDACRQMDETKE
jgi:PAS domain-containing protein